MNVLFAYGFCGLGGVEAAILNRCDALRAKGIGSTVFFREFYGEGAKDVAQLSHVHVGLDHASRLLQQRFDVVCVIDYPDFVPLVREASADSMVLLETHASITTRLIEFHRLADAPTVAAVIVPSQYNRDLVLQVSEGRRPIYVVPNGVDTNRFRPQSVDELQAHFASLLSGPAFVWVGRLEDEKNPQGFLEFCVAMHELRRDANFIGIGDAPQDPEYSRRLRHGLPHQVRERFTFIPAVPNSVMPLYYSLAGETGGCLVSTSRFESVPMIFLEAMACHCPVLSTDVGGVREILEHGVTGLLFESGDVTEGAVRAAWRLFDPPGFRGELTSRAAAFVHQHHSLDVVGARFTEVLGLVTAHGRALG